MKEYKKLIRDKIPEIIQKSGDSSVTRILESEEFKRELLKKLIEESKEVAGAIDDKKELTKEVGDVKEILEYIIKEFDLDKEEIEKIRKERKKSRGGFEKKIFLERTEKNG
jgi:predicted house-cleaning noncanonical NTP pyrophosphatase (MazG superfamily)